MRRVRAAPRVEVSRDLLHPLLGNWWCSDGVKKCLLYPLSVLFEVPTKIILAIFTDAADSSVQAGGWTEGPESPGRGERSRSQLLFSS